MSDNWQPTANQRERAERSRTLLEEREVPMWGDATKCLYVGDDDEVRVRDAADVAKRTLVLWAVELRAEGVDQDECHEIISKMDLWHAVSPEEKAFLQDPNPDPDLCQSLVWRLEAMWVLMWALGHLDDLPWPTGMCDVPKLVKALNPHESDPLFIKNAKLLPTATLLDAQDLTMKIHWAIRDAYIKGLCIPEDLDWRRDDGMPVPMCAVVGVVEQRHHALNWILKFMDPENWDVVDTPT